MTRYFILSIIFLAAATFSCKTSLAAADKAIKTSVSDNIDIAAAAPGTPSEPVKNVPALPAAQGIPPVQKAHGHVPTMDELAHIHRFHKGRVKKIKRHHGKFWALSKLLLVICHIVLLVIAFMHVTH
ncbi:MAG: hypothetical protein ABIR30_09180 [Chitinophagaceae bacterium]